MPNNREGPLITFQEIPKTQEHNVENSIVAKGAPKNETPEKPPEDTKKEPQGQPVSVRTKETLPPQKEQTPQGVEETVEFRDEEGTFQLKRKIPTGEGSLTVVPKDGGEASELAELAGALRSAPPAPDSLKEG